MLDLANLGKELEVNDSTYEQIQVEDSYSKIPEGTYLARVEKIEIKDGQTPANGDLPNVLLRWQLVIIEGEFTNRKLFRNNNVLVRSTMLTEEELLKKNQEAQKWLKTDLSKCGIFLEKLSKLPERYTELLDLELDVYVKPKDNNTNVYINGLHGIGKGNKPNTTTNKNTSETTTDIPF